MKSEPTPRHDDDKMSDSDNEGEIKKGKSVSYFRLYRFLLTVSGISGGLAVQIRVYIASHARSGCGFVAIKGCRTDE